MPAKRVQDEIPLYVQLFIYLSYSILTVVGYLRDWLDVLFVKHSHTPKGYAPITRDFEEFFRRRMYRRVIDCFNRPISGCASGKITVLDRDIDTLQFNDDRIDCLNLASYNYLGFAKVGESICEPHVFQAIDNYGISMSSSPSYAGDTVMHRKLENMIAKYVGAEDAMIFGMGWATNSTAIPSLVGKGCLIISDSINHNSLITGARLSGADIKTFPHNDAEALEKIVRRAVIDGQPKSHRPWKKILIIVEGVYSMEGEICDLRSIVEVKKKYKCYLYLDEAHSIGAVGVTGRGACEFCGVNPRDVDILMGTFTKSFGAIGGYVAGTSQLVNVIRNVCASRFFSSGMSPACVAQTMAALQAIDTDNGKARIKQLIENSNYFRKKLIDMGLLVLGDYGSAVIPVLIGYPSKVAYFSRELLRHGVAVVIAGYPATPLLLARVRFCISAAHKKEDLTEALKHIETIANDIQIVYKKTP